jgi:hypothetical protein
MLTSRINGNRDNREAFCFGRRETLQIDFMKTHKTLPAGMVFCEIRAFDGFVIQGVSGY